MVSFQLELNIINRISFFIFKYTNLLKIVVDLDAIADLKRLIKIELNN